MRFHSKIVEERIEDEYKDVIRRGGERSRRRRGKRYGRENIVQNGAYFQGHSLRFCN
jgi:hypothetical protein